MALVHSAGGAVQPAAHRLVEGRDDRADVADDGRDDLDVGVHFLRLDVDLDELLRRFAPALALAVREQPVQPRADQHDDVGFLQHRRAGSTSALRMGVGEQALGHAHRQERHAALLDKALDLLVGLRVGRALAENDERTFCALEHVERALDRSGRGDLRGRRIDHLDQRLLAGLGIHHLAEQLCRQIEIDAAGTAGDRRADRAGKTDADVLGVQHAIGRLAQRLRDRELVHLFVIALLEVDDLALGGARDQDHRVAIGGGVRERGETVEEAGRGNREADAGLLGEIAGDARRVACVLLVAEGDHANAGGLGHAAQIRDRDARHIIDGGDAVQLERVDDEMKAIRQFLLGARCFGLGRGIQHGPCLPGLAYEFWFLRRR